MPELPEVECVRRTLAARVAGRRVVAVRVSRPEIVRGQQEPSALLQGGRIKSVRRHGKQLGLLGDRGGCIAIHLGMSGQLCAWNPSNTGLQRGSDTMGSEPEGRLPAHTHVVWLFENDLAMRFTDPRRFGGVWTFPHLDTLIKERWSRLGPDALEITPAQLHKRLSTTRRGLKSTLLDQSVVAGLGNIYVDELLFSAKLHPEQAGCSLDRGQVVSLVRRIRALLSNAIARGGSSLRDYVDADSRAGTQQQFHRVYGRAGSRCTRRGCSDQIKSMQIAGRTTAWCPGCQVLGDST